MAEQQSERELRTEKLATVEDLLWNTSFLRQQSESPGNTGNLTPAPCSCCPVTCINWSLFAITFCPFGGPMTPGVRSYSVGSSVAPAGCFSSRALARLCHRALVICTQCIEVTVDDIQLEVSQQDESGPRMAVGGILEGKDALRLSIRQLLLTPQGMPLDITVGANSISRPNLYSMLALVENSWAICCCTTDQHTLGRDRTE